MLLQFYIKLIPLYINIIIGYILGKKLNVTKASISNILIYFITPVIVFNSIYSSEFNSKNIFLPIVSFVICLIVALTFLFIGKIVLKDTRKNLLAFMVGNGNTGYFGIPLVLALFGTDFLNQYIFANLGIVLFENTIGLFIIAKGNLTAKQSIIKLTKIPIIYAVAAAILLKSLNIEFGEVYDGFALSYRGVFSTLGVMLIGIAMSEIKQFELDKKLIGTSFIAKFAIWPLLMFFVIYLNSYLKFFDPQYDTLLIIQSIVPLPGNAVAFATFVNIHPDKAATTVFLSTLFALLFIPAFLISLSII